ncbi:MAG: cytochrome c3 family protein [Phycisphaerales bacterium]|nr:MAG: cytochrome c3 family protein [Phycisphaerales bacterium]
MSRSLTKYVVLVSGAAVVLGGLAGITLRAGDSSLRAEEPGRRVENVSLQVKKQAPENPHEELSCFPCHTRNNPTPEKPYLRPCPRTPATPAAAAEGSESSVPKMIILDDLEDLYGPVLFDHAVHADMATMTTGCAACHHYTPAGQEHPECRSCHEQHRNGNGNGNGNGDSVRMPGLKGAYHRQCMRCHREWTHDTACNMCHSPKNGNGSHSSANAGPSPGIVGDRTAPVVEAEPTHVYRTSHVPGSVVTFHHDDHVEKYGLRCVDCHRGDSCGRCHDATTRQTQVDHVRTCCNCHEEKNCSFCHADSERPSFDHGTATGWPLGQYHAAVSCADCHGTAESYRVPSTNCQSCHSNLQGGTFDHSVTGIPLAGSHAHFECERCHRGGDLGAPASCDRCHPDITCPPHWPGRRAPEE